jgi:hypothetical protein
MQDILQLFYSEVAQLASGEHGIVRRHVGRVRRGYALAGSRRESEEAVGAVGFLERRRRRRHQGIGQGGARAMGGERRGAARRGS